MSTQGPSQQGQPGGTSGAGETDIVQQLNFGGIGGAVEGGERLMELAAQVEDLTYQLSTTQEALERAEQSEVRRLIEYAVSTCMCYFIVEKVLLLFLHV